jgi:hypothetical protein
LSGAGPAADFFIADFLACADPARLRASMHKETVSKRFSIMS